MRRHQLVTPAGRAVEHRSTPTSRPPPAHAARTLPPHLAARLQRAYGNRDVQRIVRGTLKVGPAGDRLEQQADRVGSQALGGDHHAHAHPHGPGTGGGVVDAGTQQDIERARGRGRALPEHVRVPMEQALGADLRGVRLHSDAEADRLNRGLRSQAFTTGRDVFLRRGHTDVSSPAGRELIAHELTHVAQQAGRPPVIQRKLFLIGPNQVYDDQLGITATLKSGFDNIFVGDSDAMDYEIGTATNGDPGLVVSTAGFMIGGAPSGFTLGTSTQVQQPPDWNPGPRSPYYESPKGTTVISNTPGGTAWEQRSPTHTTKQKPRRTSAGYINPGQFEPAMLPLWKAAAQSPIPGDVATDDELIDWLQDPSRHFELTDSTQTQKIVVQGYLKPTGSRKMSQAVLGHHTSASTLFNTAGHQTPRLSNYAYNQTVAPFHGLEHYKWSSASGSKEERYQSPRPDRGSLPEYYDRSDPDFSGVPWHTYQQVDPGAMITYIEGKLAGVATAAAKDLEYQRAVMELAVLRTNYSQGHADQFLALIKRKGW